ncbi:hypothetical protein GGR50DRAFT_695257 [Xylaria sp. CBS 124048]|nr:hypothetical protein GGR50DRAFT_695257 [Xylaria sp. CBS 124048]
MGAVKTDKISVVIRGTLCRPRSGNRDLPQTEVKAHRRWRNSPAARYPAELSGRKKQHECADIQKRPLSDFLDRLPVIANYCQYSIRLNSTELGYGGHSSGLAILALLLMDGKILHNEQSEEARDSGREDTAGFLKLHAFGQYSPPTFLPSPQLEKASKWQTFRPGVSTLYGSDAGGGSQPRQVHVVGETLGHARWKFREYRGVFICNQGEDMPRHVFTSFREQKFGDAIHLETDLDKCVSIEVDCTVGNGGVLRRFEDGIYIWDTSRLHS